VAASAAPRQTGGFSRRDSIAFGVTAAIAVVALGLRAIDASPVVVFSVAGVAVAALAFVLGEATEQAGESSSPRLAALLNATFGNAPELIIVVLTVNAGLIGVAKASIIGSVLGNILLILGLSLIAGGLRHGHLRFAKRPAGVNASMLTLAVVLVALPTAFARIGHTSTSDEKVVSYGAAVLMLVVYLAYLYHSLSQPQEDRGASQARWSKRAALIVLSVSAVATGVLSEVLVKAIEPTIHDTGIGETFVGLIIVPALGNVAEHLSAVRVAREHGVLDGHRLQLGPPGRPPDHGGGRAGRDDRRARRDGRVPSARARGAGRRCRHGRARVGRRRGHVDRGPRARRDLHPRRALFLVPVGPAPGRRDLPGAGAGASTVRR
jgi:Ca2+:H+ antiporter